MSLRGVATYDTRDIILPRDTVLGKAVPRLGALEIGFRSIEVEPAVCGQKLQEIGFPSNAEWL